MGANDQGASSCVSSATGTTSDLITGSTFTVEQAANDKLGDGDKKSCDIISWFAESSNTAKYLALAFGLLFVGLFAAYLSVYVYNYAKRKELRCQAQVHQKPKEGVQAREKRGHD